MRAMRQEGHHLSSDKPEPGWMFWVLVGARLHVANLYDHSYVMTEGHLLILLQI